MAFTSKFNPAPTPWLPLRDQDVVDSVALANLRDRVGKTFENPDFELKIVPDVRNFFAADMFFRIKQSDMQDQKLVMILPSPENNVYTSVTEALNKYGISCRNVHVFFLYEYANEAGEVIPLNHPFSLSGQFMNSFYNRLDEKLRMPLEQIHFYANKAEGYSEELAALGGADVAYTSMTFAGGIGAIDGFTFVADTWEELLQMGSRQVTLALETAAQDSMRGMFGCSGDIWAVPPCALTVGPKDLAAAKERVDVEFLTAVGGNPAFQKLSVKLALLAPIAPNNPAALLRTLPGICYVADTVANVPNYPGDMESLNDTLNAIRAKEAN